MVYSKIFQIFPMECMSLQIAKKPYERIAILPKIYNIAQRQVLSEFLIGMEPAVVKIVQNVMLSIRVFILG